MAKTDRIAFKIHHSVAVEDKKFRKTDYYETDDKHTISLLSRCAPHTVSRVPLRRWREDVPPAAAEEPKVASAPKEPAPDFSHQTIRSLRQFIDACGRELPHARCTKAQHEAVAKATWEEGHRPHPLWGIPGGPEVAPGLPGPPAGEPDYVSAALEAAEAMGIEVPEEAREHLASLTGPSEPSKAPQSDEREQGDGDIPLADEADTGAPEPPSEPHNPKADGEPPAKE